MRKTYGLIGTGNMGSAVAKAVAQCVPADSIWLCNRTPEKAQKLAEELQCKSADKETLAKNCSYIFLGVKPQMMGALLEELSPILAARTDRFVLVSMAAGLTMADIRAMAGGNYPVIRIMPNTPVSIGEGVILYDAVDVTSEEMEEFCKALSAAGLLDHLSEPLFDAGTAVAGCGPAFADLFMEALADGGVLGGLPRDKALLYAAQMLKGAAALVLETGEHPGKLKDAVCSPGGSTIAGVQALEDHAFRSAVLSAVEAAIKRTKELRK